MPARPAEPITLRDAITETTSGWHRQLADGACMHPAPDALMILKARRQRPGEVTKINFGVHLGRAATGTGNNPPAIAPECWSLIAYAQIRGLYEVVAGLGFDQGRLSRRLPGLLPQCIRPGHRTGSDLRVCGGR